MISNLIVPTYRRYDLLERFLVSLDYPIAHLLIVDNGGAVPDVQKPDVVENLTVLKMPSPFGVSGAFNIGFKSFPFADRWFVCSDDVEFRPGGLKSWLEQSSIDDVAISAEWPHWQFFTVGENVLKKVGLFDENFFPANFEDDDFSWRCGLAGVVIRQIDVAHHHVQQGTVHFENLVSENARTFPMNENYFKEKQNRSDVSAGQWSLERRRAQEWRR